MTKIRLLFWLRVGAALIIGAGGFSGSARAATDDALDSARRELQLLPATNTPEAPDKNLGPTNKFDLALPQMPSSSAPKSNSGTNDAAPAQGWLLDALQKPSPVGRQENLNTLPGRSGSRGEEKLRTAKDTANAWNPYLQQWLLPQNRNLVTNTIDVGTSARNKSAAEESAKMQARVSTGLSAAEKLTGDATYHDPLAQRPNPYLDENNSTSAWPSIPNFTAPSSSQINQPSRSLDAPDSKSSSGPYSLSGDTKSSPAHHNDGALPPPNTPLVNAPKYFPQLDRF